MNQPKGTSPNIILARPPEISVKEEGLITASVQVPSSNCRAARAVLVRPLRNACASSLYTAKRLLAFIDSIAAGMPSALSGSKGNLCSRLASWPPVRVRRTPFVWRPLLCCWSAGLGTYSSSLSRSMSLRSPSSPLLLSPSTKTGASSGGAGPGTPSGAPSTESGGASSPGTSAGTSVKDNVTSRDFSPSSNRKEASARGLFTASPGWYTAT